MYNKHFLFVVQIFEIVQDLLIYSHLLSDLSEPGRGDYNSRKKDKIPTWKGIYKDFHRVQDFVIAFLHVVALSNKL